MTEIIKYITFILSLIIIVLVLFQGGKNDGLNGFASKNQSLRLFSQQKARGTDKALTIITVAAVGILMVLVKIS